jgi:phosphoribosylformylglycinamidine cyclo-ligase
MHSGRDYPATTASHQSHPTARPRYHEREIMTAKQPLTYKDAGVDIDAGDDLVERIKPLARSTSRPGVLGGIGGFGGLFEIDLSRWPRPVLVSGTDGVGTKLRLAIDLDRYDTIGIDLVAMCANDVIVQGAEPLFFLDYYASGKLSVETAAAVIRGIATGCQQAGAALLGGETAELPGMYAGNDFDLAGFCVGIVNRDEIIDGSGIRPGDVILGLRSSGPHSNGYSLIRRVLEVSRTPLDTAWEGGTLGSALLAPTRLYVRSLLALIATCRVQGLAHITGGGLPGNVVRVLPPRVNAVLHKGAWKRPALFEWLQAEGNVPEDDLLRTFNCGIGMTVIVRPEEAAAARDVLEKAGESVAVVGEITTGTGQVELRG